MTSFIPEIEMQDAKTVRNFQQKKLAEHLLYLKYHSKFYTSVFQKEKIDIEKIKSLKDLTHIPVTTKKDLQERNSDFICVGEEKIIDFITTSGTLGDPVTFAMTDKDLERLAYNEFISFACTGGHAGEKYQLMTTIDKRFMAGLAYFLGIRKMGAGIIRVGNGIPELQWDTIMRMSPNAIICVPSFILKVIEYAEKNGIDYVNSSVKKAICIGENLRNSDFELNTLGQRIKSKWDIDLYSTYASTEMATTFTECRFHQGGHHHPELIITELLDDENNPVAEGEAGELVVTPLGVEGMPLLRFKTGDMCRFYNNPCPCGRTTARISPIIGRKNQMIKYKGTTLFPPMIFDVLNNLEEVKNYIVEVGTNDYGTDTIVVTLGCTNPCEEYEKQIKDNFRAKLRVAPEIRFMDIDEITKKHFLNGNRKPLNFIDNRKPKNEHNTI